MSVIRKYEVKTDANTIVSYDLGAEAANVTMSDGSDVEAAIGAVEASASAARRVADEAASACEVLDAQVAANVTASTEASADYAAEVVDARVDYGGETYASLGAHIRELTPKISAIDAALVLAGLHRDGKVYGVKFPTASYSSSPLGTRTESAAGLSAAVSTESVAAVNDFDYVPLFHTVNVNGYLDSDYNFVETAVEGDRNFALDGSNGDVYVRFQLRFFRYITDDANYEELQLTDTFRPNEGWCTYSVFTKPDGGLKPYCYIAKYQMSYNSDGVAASVSGACPAWNTYASQSAGTTTPGISHNSQITIMTGKGSQYCGTTIREYQMIADQFLVEFATRDSQSIMYGAANYLVQVQAVYDEGVASSSEVSYVTVSASDGDKFVVGSCVSVSASGLTSAPDRGTANAHATINRAKILKKETETFDGVECVALVLDTPEGGVDTAAGMYVTTMPWHTGACDGVLGSSGSPVSNTSGKYPMMYRGIENLWGNFWAVVSDVVISSYVPYVCYDNTKFSASAPTDDYTAVGYTVYGTTGAVPTELGYDAANPEVRLCTAGGGTSTTYYCSTYFISSGTREVLLGGSLDGSRNIGLYTRNAGNVLTGSAWARGARISTCGKGIK